MEGYHRCLVALEDMEDEDGVPIMGRVRMGRMKKLMSSRTEKQSRRFMNYSRPIQSEKENSSNSRVIKANTGLGVQCQNKQYLGVLVSSC